MQNCRGIEKNFLFRKKRSIKSYISYVINIDMNMNMNMNMNMLMLMSMLDEHFICELFVPVLPVLLRMSINLTDHK